ncbi:MAG: CehA/McbA family metallohydrolase [Agriterribacter sp.]
MSTLPVHWRSFIFAATLFLPIALLAQHPVGHEMHKDSSASTVESQPLLAQALRLQEALSFLGSALSTTDINKLKALEHQSPAPEVTKRIQEILDPYCLNIVNINPEARVKVERGGAGALLVQGGWTSFLVKVNNDAGVTAQLQVESPNAVLPMHAPSYEHRVNTKNIITAGQAANRFLELQFYRHLPLQSNLSGLKIEYVVLQVYSKDAGKREVEIGYNIGQGTQDIGFRNTNHILFTIKPSVKVVFDIKDEDGSPAMASFRIADSIERIPGRLEGTYPLPSRRVAAYDEYPDFFFQPQIYRMDGETVLLPPGKYTVTFTRGPEYISQTTQLIVPADVKTIKLPVRLKRWINLAKLGWHSADHHVHAAGCSHYDSPEEGVEPKDMWRQALGEDLNVSAVLAWGPSWYHQKTYFTGKDDPLSNKSNIMRNDVEVSGFPSSHAGHIVLLRLKEDDYPGTTTIEQWPSWTAPILSWAKSQGGITGYAHSGWGLEPSQPTEDLPNYVLPKMDGIGANEYVVTVTQNLIDFYSLGDTPLKWELNMWYHSLNCGFRTRASGETDFPCITDMRVGLSRSYFKSDKGFSYDGYVDALKTGSSYVSDGFSHIMNFDVNGVEAGTKESEVNLPAKASVNISADVAAYLPEDYDSKRQEHLPYWNIERARIGNTRKVSVELIVNGQQVDSTEIVANGTVNKINFNYPVDHSSWVALRVWGSAHSNPVFVIVDHKPIHEKRSAEWCKQALDKCWEMKEANIRTEDKAPAKAAYDKARAVYDEIIKSGQ